jgi:acid stress-induced BolA-like protein IbaG/YrbA
MDLHAKVVRLLRRQLADFEHQLEKLPGGRVSGVVISSAFNGMDHQKRQAKLWANLRSGLDADELRSVGAIAALTPAEASVKAS